MPSASTVESDTPTRSREPRASQPAAPVVWLSFARTRELDSAGQLMRELARAARGSNRSPGTKLRKLVASASMPHAYVVLYQDSQLQSVAVLAKSIGQEATGGCGRREDCNLGNHAQRPRPIHNPTQTTAAAKATQKSSAAIVMESTKAWCTPSCDSCQRCFGRPSLRRVDRRVMRMPQTAGGRGKPPAL